MELGFTISYLAFFTETVIFFIGIAVIFILGKKKNSSLEKIVTIFLLLTTMLALLALLFPVTFIKNFPEALHAASPISILLLAGSILMPIILLLIRVYMYRKNLKL